MMTTIGIDENGCQLWKGPGTVEGFLLTEVIYQTYQVRGDALSKEGFETLEEALTISKQHGYQL